MREQMFLAALSQEAGQAAGQTFCFPCSLNSGWAVVLVLLYCKILHVNPLNSCLPIMWRVSDTTKDEK